MIEKITDPIKEFPLSSLLYPLPLGIAAGLFLGKLVGVFLFG